VTDPDQPVPAANRPVSLSQALLAPLDAIFKAQLHAARSFLNLLLQIGYPHQPVDKDGEPIEGAPENKTPYELAFQYDVTVDGKVEHHQVKIPALALVPIAPIAVDTASFRFALRVQQIAPHKQIQASEAAAVTKESVAGFSRDKRPWYLVEDPVSILGTFAPAPAPADAPQAADASQAVIQIEVNLGRIPTPAGLARLLTSLGQNAKTGPPSGGEPPGS
jgi:hypothetical protein